MKKPPLSLVRAVNSVGWQSIIEFLFSIPLYTDASLSGMPRRMSHRAELSIAVRERYWGQGIGSMLMKELIQYAKDNGIEIINLDVRKDNEQAIRLYEKFGFRHIGTSPAYFKIEEEYIDFAVMYLDLR